MYKKRQLTELTLWLAALVAAVMMTGSDGWQKSHARHDLGRPSAQAASLR